MVTYLSEETRRLLEEEVRRGRFGSVDEAVRAGLAALEVHGDFGPGELEGLLEVGSREIEGGEVVEGAEPSVL